MPPVKAHAPSPHEGDVVGSTGRSTAARLLAQTSRGAPRCPAFALSASARQWDSQTGGLSSGACGAHVINAAHARAPVRRRRAEPAGRATASTATAAATAPAWPSRGRTAPVIPAVEDIPHPADVGLALSRVRLRQHEGVGEAEHDVRPHAVPRARTPRALESGTLVQPRRKPQCHAHACSHRSSSERTGTRRTRWTRTHWPSTPASSTTAASTPSPPNYLRVSNHGALQREMRHDRQEHSVETPIRGSPRGPLSRNRCPLRPALSSRQAPSPSESMYVGMVPVSARPCGRTAALECRGAFRAGNHEQCALSWRRSLCKPSPSCRPESAMPPAPSP